MSVSDQDKKNGAVKPNLPRGILSILCPYLPFIAHEANRLICQQCHRQLNIKKIRIIYSYYPPENR